MKRLLHYLSSALCVIAALCWIGMLGNLLGFRTLGPGEWREVLIGSFIWFVPGLILSVLTAQTTQTTTVERSNLTMR